MTDPERLSENFKAPKVMSVNNCIYVHAVKNKSVKNKLPVNAILDSGNFLSSVSCAFVGMS